MTQLDFVTAAGETSADREASLRHLLGNAQAKLASAFRMKDERAIGYWRGEVHRLHRRLHGDQGALL